MTTISPADVLSVIRKHTQDNRATKRMIATALGLPYSNSHNNAVDRAIRDAVTELRKRGEPVCSDSGTAGYYYDPYSIEITIADYKSRIIDLSETVRALERGRVNTQVKQLELV